MNWSGFWAPKNHCPGEETGRGQLAGGVIRTQVGLGVAGLPEWVGQGGVRGPRSWKRRVAPGGVGTRCPEDQAESPSKVFEQGSDEVRVVLHREFWGFSGMTEEADR